MCLQGFSGAEINPKANMHQKDTEATEKSGTFYDTVDLFSNETSIVVTL